MLEQRLHTVFFDLLRAGLWGDGSNTAFGDLTPADWEAIYAEAVKQTVSGVVYAGIESNPNISLPHNDLLAKWAVRAVKIAGYNDKVNKTVSQLAAKLNDAGISPVLLKGQATALLYRNPNLRECGDIDFYFHNENEFDKACEIVGRGFLSERKNDGSFVCQHNGVVVELHHKMFDMLSISQECYLEDAINSMGFNPIDWTDNDRVEVLTPAPVLNMLMQNLHILRHALCFGIGLRQFCDYAVCYKTLTDDHKSTLNEMLTTLNLHKWNNMLLDFISTYLYGSSQTSASGPLYKIVMENGNFGFSADSRSWRQILSNNVRLFKTVPGQSLTTLYSLLTR